MAIINITQYERMAVDSRGNSVPVGENPPISTQALTYTVAAESVVFDKKCKFIRLLSNENAYFLVSDDSTAATVSSQKIESNVAEYFGIAALNADVTLSVYDGVS